MFLRDRKVQCCTLYWRPKGAGARFRQVRLLGKTHVFDNNIEQFKTSHALETLRFFKNATQQKWRQAESKPSAMLDHTPSPRVKSPTRGTL